VPDPTQPAPRHPGILLAVWASFLIASAVSAPVPGVNEPHYLCKARHFWQPEWCANDFFLASSNAHTVFYGTVGALTPWLDFPTVAWIGRIAATLVLALGWCRLVTSICPSRTAPLYACWVFTGLAACGNFSGEWLIGGVEGKVFCYGFLFAAYGHWATGQPLRAGLAAGLAVAFHPVVGVWGLLAWAGLVLTEASLRRFRGVPQERRPPETLRTRFLALGLLSLAALPGLIPVVQLITTRVPADVASDATYIQVFYRLAHHLDPMMFLARAYLGYAALTIVWLVLMRWESPGPLRRWNTIVAFSLLFALVGIAIAWGPRPAHLMPAAIARGSLLKFYPFRLADILLPLAVTLQGVATLASLRSPAAGLICGLVFAAGLVRADSLVHRDLATQRANADWIAACTWIDRNLPANALVYAPPNRDTFKWYARRAEYISFKDCPQDAVGIVEWNRRLNFVKTWFQDRYDDEFYSTSELRRLKAEAGITHILTDRLGPMEPDPVYENESFQVYDLTTLERRGWLFGL